jgi:integrase
MSQLKMKPFTAKFCANVTQEGEYRDRTGPIAGLILVVGSNGSRKSWLLRYRYKGKRREMGLGPYPEISLAEARQRGGEARHRLIQGFDPIEDRREEKQKRWRANAKNVTFKAMADDLIDYKANRAAKRWRAATLKSAQTMVNHLKPLHALRVTDITPRHIFDVLDPLRATTPPTAEAVRIRAQAVFDWASANEAMDGKANPASMKGPLRVLFGSDSIEPEHEPLAALEYYKVPPLMTKLCAFKPRTHYTVGEAARAVGLTRMTLYINLHKGRLVATKPLRPVFAGSWQEWQIAPNDLFKLWPKVVDVIPGLPPVTIYLLQFLILNASRFHEVQYMRWSEYREDEQLWAIPWQRVKGRNKVGAKEIRTDHIIPLAKRSIEILQLLREQQKRDKIADSLYVFGNYMTANKSGARIGQPVCDETVRNLLRKLLPPEDAVATLHGMRTAFRSWAGAQNRWKESDLERAIAHIKGHGETHVSRLYSRQNPQIMPLIEIFEAWADFVLGGKRTRQRHSNSSPSSHRRLKHACIYCRKDGS